MKKIWKLSTIVLAVFMVSAGNVYATDLTEKITANDGLGGITTFTKTYDAENDVNNLKVSLVVNEESINKILNQKPGVGAQLSTFYIGISPNTGNVPVYKENYYYYHSDTKTVDEIKADILARIGEDDLSNTETVWPIGVGILYYDSVNNKWVKSDTAGDGVTTCRQDLMNKLGITDASELKYGENFRFFMYNNLDWWMVWSDKNPATATPTKVEYIKVSYEILFPIKSSNGTESVFHISLKDAIENGHDEITINEDLIIDEDLIIPEGKTLIVNDGVTLTISEDASLTFEEGSVLDGNGLIEKNGKIFVGDKKLFFVNILESSNGKVSVDNFAVLDGEMVTITVTPDKGYELDKIEVLDADGKEVVVTNGKFVVNSDVEISAKFKKVEEKVEKKTEEKNPETSDINLALILGMFGLASVGTIISLKKRNSKVNG
ncbi:MAG: hypothetical protein ACI310_04990 [Bacilli bacterium]